MGFNFAKAKTLVRKTVHKTLSVQAFYKDKTISVPVEIYSRWHTKYNSFGGLDDSAGYAEVLENIDRLIFSSSDARSTDIKRGGVVWFPNYLTGDVVTVDSQLEGATEGSLGFVLQTRRPSSHPEDEVWEVTRQ